MQSHPSSLPFRRQRDIVPRPDRRAYASRYLCRIWQGQHVVNVAEGDNVMCGALNNDLPGIIGDYLKTAIAEKESNPDDGPVSRVVHAEA